MGKVKKFFPNRKGMGKVKRFFPNRKGMGKVKRFFPDHKCVRKIKFIQKKAIFFSIISVFIIILFVATTELTTKFKVQETDMEITRTKIKLLNSFVEDMENSYFEKVIIVSTKNALMGLSKYYSETNFDSSRLNRRIEYVLDDVIYDGVLTKNDKSKVNLSNYIEYDYTIQGLTKNITSVFNRLGFNVYKFTVNISKNELKQIDPWTLELSGYITYDLRDKSNIVTWKGTSKKKVNVSVFGLYGFDYVGSSKSNIGIINKSWKVDTLNKEPSILKKMSEHPINPGMGICSPNNNC